MLSFILLIFILGICVGSFLNVCIYRIPQKESIVFGGSHCMSCGERIKAYDLIPVLSYFILGGQCRNCSAKLSIRYPLIELLNGLLYVLVFLVFGLSSQTLITFALVSTLLVLALIDIDTMEVPNGIVLFIIIVGVINATFTSNISLWDSILGFLAGGLPLLILAILSKGGMGGGDIKLMAACGLILGARDIVLALFLASILAAFSCIPLLIIKKKGFKDILPFVPFLACGIIISYLFSVYIIDWYLGLII